MYTIPSPAPIARPKSWAVTPLLVFLLPTTFAALVSLPFLCFLSIVPIVGFFSLPTLLSVSLYLRTSSRPSHVVRSLMLECQQYTA